MSKALSNGVKPENASHFYNDANHFQDQAESSAMALKQEENEMALPALKEDPPTLPEMIPKLGYRDPLPSSSTTDKPLVFLTSMSASGSASPSSSVPSSSASGSATPPLRAPTNNSRKPLNAPTQLIDNLPVAREEALSTFQEIEQNWYMYKSLGRSREMLENGPCDCSFTEGEDHIDTACGDRSDCINRLTQVECLETDCRCRSYCQNQRFQKRQYSPIEVVKTELKGYGLRVEADIPKDAFIYEYVGDVVGDASFKKRMRDYAEEGIKHFYFMMLQKDEFIDATKSGGIGRFANHSCNPNCYVAKWTVGEYVRMGIFAKRKILKNEELTFNYNVDRYGHQAQTCFCGEPNCLGFIGGKTQTDISTMDDLYLGALGLDDDELLAMKGNKKKRGKKIDDPDFMPVMKPIAEKDVPKVVQAVKQTQSRKVLHKLLTRIKITSDEASLRFIMRLRGYSLMKNIVDDYIKDSDILTLAFECLSTWPSTFRNKINDSHINDSVQVCLQQENEDVKTLAQKLIDQWEALPIGYRIPKTKFVGEEYGVKPVLKRDAPDDYPRKKKRLLYSVVDGSDLGRITRKPPRSPTPEPSPVPIPTTPIVSIPRPLYIPSYIPSVDEIIANAKMQEAERRKAAEAQAKMEEQLAIQKAASEKAERKRRRAGKKTMSSADKDKEREKRKEKKLLKLVGAVVVKSMSKYGKGMDRDTFKKYAKELTHVITEKEKKSRSYKENRLDKLSDEKVTKIKKFAKEYIAKILHKLSKSSSPKKPSHSSTLAEDTPSVSLPTPDSAIGAHEMTVEEAMDMESDSQSEDEDEDEDEDMEPQVSTAANACDAMEVDVVDVNGKWKDAELDNPRGCVVPEDLRILPPAISS